MKLAEIWIYPIKSCQGISLPQAELLSTGLEFDRQWMMVKPDGSMFTQRERPRMALIQLELKAGRVHLKVGAEDSLELTAHQSEAASPLDVTVWGESVKARLEMNPRVHEYLSDHLHEPVRLVAAGADFQRFVVEKKAGQTKVQDQSFYFADQQPLLITTTSSLAELNSRLDEAVPMSRFRPNLVIENAGDAGFVEEAWASIELPQVSISIRQKCARCPVITIDQETGQKVSHEPLKTLSGFRREGNKVNFGMHAWATKLGQVSVSDRVRALGIGSL